MKQTRSISLAALMACGLLSLGVNRVRAAENTEAPPAQDGFAAFNILVERNIFDPNRQPAQPGDAPTTATAATAPPPTERLALQGVLLDQGVAVAFFEGTSPELNNSVVLGDSIAGCRVLDIQTDRIELAVGEQRLTLPVAGQLIRQGDAPWTVAEEAVALHANEAASADKDSSASATKAEAAPEEAPAADDSSDERASRRARRAARREQKEKAGNEKTGNSESNDILRKMMERRKKEMGQ